jgi:hypothetical protein
MKIFLSGFILAFLIGVLGIGYLFEEKIEQPIQFNHQVHLDLDCSGCHDSVTTDSFAGIPTAETCLLCHDTPLTENPEEEKIRVLAGQEGGIQWQKILGQPPFVFFSHRRHVEIAGLECELCHPGVETATTPPDYLRDLTMDDCMGCHDASGVEAGCLDCHR